MLHLEPWQIFCVGAVHGWRRVDGTRRFRTAYWEIAKKNGKTTLAAGMGLIGLVADNEPGAEVYSFARRKEQARLVFDEAARMVKRSPDLRRKIKPFRASLAVDATGSKFQPLSADANMNDGPNPSMGIADELHRHKNRDLLNIMDASGLSRRQPLLLIITTAGDTTPQSPYDVERHRAERVLTGVLEDDTYFAFICCADDDKRWDDPREWAKANPNLGISVKLDELSRLCAKAKASPSDKADFLRYNLNLRIADARRAIDPDVWAANAGEPINLEALKGRPCHLAVDLSTKQDVTATVKLFPPVAEGERWVLVPRFFKPEETLDEHARRDGVPYRLWREQGFIEATPGSVVDHLRVMATIVEDATLYSIQSIPYDPAEMTSMAIALRDEHGLPAIEFIQGWRSYNEPTKRFIEMLLRREFRHGAHPVLTWMADCLRVVPKGDNKVLMPSKAKSTGRIDGIVCCIMALGLAIAPEADDRSLERAILERGGFA